MGYRYRHCGRWQRWYVRSRLCCTNGLDFRIIEQNSAVMDTRHWYGTIDQQRSKEKGHRSVDRAELLSEISRSMGGTCDQRVVKTWINESAAMHDFVSGILESEPYNYVCNLTSGDESQMAG